MEYECQFSVDGGGRIGLLNSWGFRFCQFFNTRVGRDSLSTLSSWCSSLGF